MDPSNLELERIVEATTKKAVVETLTTLGIDTSNPIKAQRDFQVMREMAELFTDKEFEADLQHLRRWRMAMNDVRSKGMIALIGLIVTGLAGLLVLGFQSWTKGG